MFRVDRRKRPRGGVFYAVAGLGLLYEAVPRLPRQMGVLPETFTVAWCGFALLVVGANLWHLLGADKERAVDARERLFVPIRTDASAPPVLEAKRGSRRRQAG